MLAMLFDAQGGSRKGQVRPIQMIILAVISGGLAVCAGLLSRAVFRWGNRGRRRLVMHLRLDPSPKLRLDPSPNLRLDPSPNLRLDPSPNLRLDPSPNLRLDPSPNRNPNLRPHSSPDRSPNPNPNSNPEPNQKTDLRLDGPRKKGRESFSTVDPVAALGALKAAAAATVASAVARPAQPRRESELLSPRLTAALEVLANRSLGLRVRCAAHVRRGTSRSSRSSSGNTRRGCRRSSRPTNPQGKVSLDATSPSTTTATTPPRRAMSVARRRWRAGAYFRGKLRRIASWAFNCFFYFMLCWIVITYAMQFGEKKTQRWLLSWVFASMHAWLIVEPAEVILIACLPWLLENKCVANCKEFAKELGIY